MLHIASGETMPAGACRARLMTEGRCFECLETGHLGRDCPKAKRKREDPPHGGGGRGRGRGRGGKRPAFNNRQPEN
jgi:hypothetical protein